jgi:A/G-specific adenine glycosylase
MPAALTRPLLRWFDRYRRDMPWRSDRDAYRIWVSEVMLQQTTVAAVIPFFNRFMASFPTVQSLAAAPEESVLKHWEGLGYYRRARHLHAAAKRIVAEFGGVFPNDVHAARSLPGVGRYILGAVLSQAYEARLPIVEANSLRLLARLFGYRGDPRQGQAWAWRTAEALLPRTRLGDFNQALMELGSQVCAPVNPKCGVCPLTTQCVAKRDNLQALIPPPKKAKDVVTVREVCLVMRFRGRVLVVKRPADATRWPGYWEFPHAESEDTIEVIARRLTGLTVRSVTPLMEVSHRVTRFAITMTVVECVSRSRNVSLTEHVEARWVTLDECEQLPMATPQRRIVLELSS